MTPQDLDKLFAEARAVPGPAAPPDLLARVLADAYAAQDARAPQPAPAVTGPLQPRRRAGLWRRAMGLFGGTAGVAGLATAMVAGVAIGLVQPAPVSAMTMLLWPEEAALDTIELIPNFGALLPEG